MTVDNIINISFNDKETSKKGDVFAVNDVTDDFTLTTNPDGTISYTKVEDIREINWVLGEDGKSKKEEGEVSAQETLTLTAKDGELTGINRELTGAMINGEMVSPDTIGSLPSGNHAIVVGDKFSSIPVLV